MPVNFGGEHGQVVRGTVFRTLLAVLVVVAGIALGVTTGDSHAVRWVTLLLSLDVGALLAFGRRTP